MVANARWVCLWIPCLLGGCVEEEPPPRTCTLRGTTINIGSTSGGLFGQDLGGGHVLSFDNRNLNFLIQYGGGTAAERGLAAVGPTECLEDIPAFPGSTVSVSAYALGHGYSARFDDGTFARFRAGEYFDGTVSVSFQYPY